ncbi:MAG: EFR1 family ferrodoxin [Clostridiales bacterium]|nr:EFR1 family ferrodoxin [Clostridiales bacterium]
MKVLICYFSGTGNTEKVADKFVSCFTELNNEVETVAVESVLDGKTLTDSFQTLLKNADLVGFGYPIHAFNAPAIVLEFAKRLPKLREKKRAFVFNTSGEPLELNNISSIKLCRLLKRRNIEVVSEYHYCMPYNIMFRHSDDMALKMWTTAEQLIPLDVDELQKNRPHVLKKVACGDFVAWVMRCEHWGGRLNGRQYKVSDECAHCEKCVRICPTHNIKIVDGKFKFGKNCLMCMRCAMLCPKNAIKIGWFNKWKVNGAYSFDEPATPEEQQHYNKMLTKAYEKYFAECDERIAHIESNRQSSQDGQVNQ